MGGVSPDDTSSGGVGVSLRGGGGSEGGSGARAVAFTGGGGRAGACLTARAAPQDVTTLLRAVVGGASTRRAALATDGGGGRAGLPGFGAGRLWGASGRGRDDANLAACAWPAAAGDVSPVDTPARAFARSRSNWCVLPRESRKMASFSSRLDSVMPWAAHGVYVVCAMQDALASSDAQLCSSQLGACGMRGREIGSAKNASSTLSTRT